MIHKKIWPTCVAGGWTFQSVHSVYEFQIGCGFVRNLCCLFCLGFIIVGHEWCCLNQYRLIVDVVYLDVGHSHGGLRFFLGTSAEACVFAVLFVEHVDFTLVPPLLGCLGQFIDILDSNEDFNSNFFDQRPFIVAGNWDLKGCLLAWNWVFLISFSPLRLLEVAFVFSRIVIDSLNILKSLLMVLRSLLFDLFFVVFHSFNSVLVSWKIELFWPTFLLLT